MFSFRTTAIEDQLDRGLVEGKVGVFCTQNCWDPAKRRYVYDIFRERGNLVKIFTPRDTELTPGTNHIEFDAASMVGCVLAGTDQVVKKVAKPKVKLSELRRMRG